MFGKLGFNAQYFGNNVRGLVQRAACVVAMLLCNAAMTSYYVQSLHQSGSLLATVINTSVGFVLAGVAGHVVFDEPLSMQWWGGAGLALAGVALLAGCAPKEPEEEGKAATRRTRKGENTPPPPQVEHVYNTRRRKSVANEAKSNK